jgi:hypothetical protein
MYLTILTVVQIVLHPAFNLCSFPLRSQTSVNFSIGTPIFINYDEYIAHLYSRILQRGKSPEEKENELQGNKS